MKTSFPTLGRAAALALLLSVPPPGAAAADAPRGIDLEPSRAFDYRAPAPGSYRLPDIGPMPDGRVLDESGARRALSAVVDGRIALVSFIYTRCSDPNGCPLATEVLYDLYFASAEDRRVADNLMLVSLSFDPRHDTPEVMAGFRGAPTAADDRRSPWAFLTTESEAALAPLLDGFDQVVKRKRDAAGQDTGIYAHQLRVYLVDRQRRIRNIYGLGFLDPRLLLTDVLTLLAEEGAPRGQAE
ncbi:MAG: SCO family protein [Rhodobacterales bacterium]|nr:SCO family protein [Rhodobacterales bacterium]